MILTISGPHGTGKSTIGQEVAKYFGLKYYSTGQAFRDLAKDMNMNLEQFTDYAEKNPEIDKRLDQKVIEIAKQGNTLIDSQLSAYLLENIADYKILLTCSLQTRVKRMAERDNTSFKKKLKETKIREKSESERYKSLYNIDLENKKQIKKLYDLIINTEHLTITEIVSKIVSSIKELKNSYSSKK